MIIKQAEIADIEDIHKLAGQIWPVAYQEILSKAEIEYMLEKFYSKDALMDQILTKGHQFYMLSNESNVKLGFAAVSKEDQLTFKLQKLYVLPAEQGKSLGKKLLDKVIDYCLQNGGKRLILNVNRYNNAQYFYKKQGFISIEEVDIDIGNNYFMNDFVMERNL